MMKTAKNAVILVTLLVFFAPLSPVLAEANFNPQFIISDQEFFDVGSWTRRDVQNFLDSKGSYLRNFETTDASGTLKTAADIIFDTALAYHINPKYILVTLQKEQSLITDDAPTKKQLDWAAGYGVCDSCSMGDAQIQKYLGFGKQVDSSAGIMRWYYENRAHPVVLKKDTPVKIDDQQITPQSWATAFLYTYTPHLHGNQNFWRIWSTWFSAMYPNGTLLRSSETGNYWLVQDGLRRHFKNYSILISRLDPKTALTVNETDLTNYPVGTEISFSNYSLLQTSTSTYLVDYDELRPFATDAVVRALGYNPQEILEVNDSDIVGFKMGTAITASTTAPQGVVYRISDLNNAYYYLKDNILYPITSPAVLQANFKNTPVEKHLRRDIAELTVADVPVFFKDGVLISLPGSGLVYVIENGRRRPIADDDTFDALGYKLSNIIKVDPVTVANIPSGEALFVNPSLISAKNKFLGDLAGPIADATSTTIPIYLIAEYPSGRIIAGKNIDTPTSIASLTKIITAHVALSNGYSLDTSYITYDAKKSAAENNYLRLASGDKITKKDAFNGMLVGSVNQFARLIAQNAGMGEDDFVAFANEYLRRSGAQDTTLVDSSGLSAENVSTARDLLKIFTKVLREDSIKKALGSTSSSLNIVRGKKTIKTAINHSNQLVRSKKLPYDIIASKTGYTNEGGSTMLMLIRNKTTDQEYVIVTLGNSDYKNRFVVVDTIARWAALKANSFSLSSSN